MTYAPLGLLAILVIFATRRLASRRTSAPRWHIVARRGAQADFSCGHRGRRNAAFSCGAVEGVFIRKIPRWLAREVPCAECVLDRLADRGPEAATGFERLVPLQHELDAIAVRQKNRPH